MSKKIEDLEKSALAEKPWQLTGEVTAQARPENSLLEEDVEFEQISRTGIFPLSIWKWWDCLSVGLNKNSDKNLFSLAPAVTEETTLQLEDIIKQRIKDQVTYNLVWKDVRSIFQVNDRARLTFVTGFWRRGP